MLDKITPGSVVNIKIVKQPTSISAAKTLVRLLSKDPQVRAENERLRKIRKTQFNPQPRGGRLYAGRLVKQHPVKGERGESGAIRATPDVLRDLRSVERFVELVPA